MGELIANVNVDGEWWGPAHDRVDPPAEVAERIINPAVWSDSAEAEGPGEAGEAGSDDLDGMRKDDLLALAEERHLDADRRWGAKKIRDTIRGH